MWGVPTLLGSRTVRGHWGEEQGAEVGAAARELQGNNKP